MRIVRNTKGIDKTDTICIIRSMNLPDYIKSIGREKAAEVFSVTPGAISHWLNGIRSPSSKTARRIVKATHGLVSFEDIFASDLSSSTKKAKVK